MREKVLVRYLLGELPEEEQVRLEERAFSDPRLTAEIRAAERDLIDEYVRGELSDGQRLRFESRFFASAARRQKVEFARALAQVAAAARESEPPVKLRRRQTVPSWLRAPAWLLGPVPAFRFATAAALLLLLGASWLGIDRARLRTQVTQLRSDLETLERQGESLRGEAAEARAHSAELAGRLELELQRLAELARENAGDRLRPGAAGASVLAVLFLPPGVGRGAAGLPQLVLPPSAAPQADLQVGLEPEDDYASFLVELGPLTGEEMWMRSGLRPRKSPAGTVLDLAVPGGVLRAGEYELKLKGLTDAGITEDVRYYYFSVLTK